MVQKNSNNPILIFYVSERGKLLSQRISDYFPQACVLRYSREGICRQWPRAGAIIWVGAFGIAVRAISPLLKDKKTDPAVLVVDEKGRFVVSVLSGHLGGANALARELAAFLSAQPVITTASDLAGLPALDLWAENHGLALEPRSFIPKIIARYVKNRELKVFAEVDVPWPETFKEVSEASQADLAISYRYLEGFSGLYARPKRLVIGLGFHQGLSGEELFFAVKKAFEKGGLSLSAVKKVATLSRKASEPGFRELASRLGAEAEGLPPVALNQAVSRFGLKSSAARKHTEVLAVAEPCAVVAAQGGKLVRTKEKVSGVTVAVAEGPKKRGRLWIVGLGPGGLSEMTPRAREALRLAERIVGYRTYLDLVRDLVSDKEVFGFGMMEEVKRARLALEFAAQGFQVALVSGGDAGVYGMAGLVFELLREEDLVGKVMVEVIPGLTAANACAARLGAPLMHDFACISLSDRLTPWEDIERRLRAAASADFVIVLYNPKSKSRKATLKRACEVLLEYRSADTPVGIARSVGRPDETVLVTTLKDLLSHKIDMQTTIFIGNSQTFLFENWMVTPRGYQGKRY